MNEPVTLKIRMYSPEHNRYLSRPMRNVIPTIISFEEDELKADDETLSLEWSIGRFDINGKEVFIGDVIETTFKWRKDDTWSGEQKTAIENFNRSGMIAKREKGVMYVKTGRYRAVTKYALRLDIENCVVIGNVHEEKFLNINPRGFVNVNEQRKSEYSRTLKIMQPVIV